MMEEVSHSRNQHLRNIAKSGGQRRNFLYGNPGTPEGRKKGGYHSIRLQKKTGSEFKQRREIFRPKNSVLLAECLGILFGDGHLSPYYMTVTTNSETDLEHARFVQKMIFQLFDIEAKITKRKNIKAVNITVTAKNLVDFLHKKGMPIGNKLTHGLSIPLWVLKNDAYARYFLRGLFDTDGSIYRDSRVIHKKQYFATGMIISSASLSLRKGVLGILKRFSFHPTGGQGEHRSIYLRRKADIVRYFAEIGSSNPKHLGRYKGFIGGVA